MGKWHGQIITCDRCGNETRCDFIGKQSTDGGYTQYNTFEDPPKDWKYYLDIDAWLCPSCNKEYLHIIKDFMKQ